MPFVGTDFVYLTAVTVRSFMPFKLTGFWLCFEVLSGGGGRVLLLFWFDFQIVYFLCTEKAFRVMVHILSLEIILIDTFEHLNQISVHKIRLQEYSNNCSCNISFFLNS